VVAIIATENTEYTEKVTNANARLTFERMNRFRFIPHPAYFIPQKKRPPALKPEAAETIIRQGPG
jgi:hypothetical protein